MLKTTLPNMCSVLMIGSPGVGLLEFQLTIVKDYVKAGEIVVLVSMDMLPKDLILMMDRFGIEKEALGRNLFIIDYHSSLLGNTEDRTIYDRNKVRTINDLEGIMFNVASIFADVKRPLKVFIFTLSTLFLYNQTNVVLKFFQISTSRIRNEYGTAIVSIYDGVHDDKAVNHLIALADGVIELKFDQDLNRMLRVRHMRGMAVSGQWIPFNITPSEDDDEGEVIVWE